MNPPNLIRLGVAAVELGVSPSTLRRWVAQRRVRAEQTLGGHARISAMEIEKIKRRSK